MDTFSHIKVLITIVLGLSITHLLKGGVKFIQHPGRAKFYSVHMLWALYIFLLLLHFWWWEFRLTTVVNWNFNTYFFIVAYITIFFVLCAILFPDDVKDYTGYEDYFYSRRKWFFGILALSYVWDVGDTLLKGRDYVQHLNIEYPIRNAVHFVLCLVAIRTSNKIFHTTIVILFILYELSWIARSFETIYL